MAKVKKQARRSEGTTQRRKVITPKKIRNYFRPTAQCLLPQKTARQLFPSTLQSRELSIKTLPFLRLVREFLQKQQPTLRINTAAVKKIQQSSQAFLINLFEETVFCAKQSKRVMIMKRDMMLARRIQGIKY